MGKLASFGHYLTGSFKNILKAIDTDSVALSLCVWLLIELSLCIWHRQFGDFVAKFVDVELLIAQFVATLSVWFVSLALVFREVEKDPHKRRNAKSIALVLMIKDEASKVPIFFAAAIAVSFGCKIIELLMNWSSFGLVGLYGAGVWLIGAASLLLFAGVVKNA